MRKQVVLIILSAVIFGNGCSEKNPTEKKTDEKQPASRRSAQARLTLTKAEMKPVEQTLKLPAQLAAYQEVSLFPKVNGYVSSVLVDIGSHVKQGQLLMVLNAPELDEAVTQAKEKYARTVSDQAISRDNYDRLMQANRTPGAISPMDLASARSKKDADSSLSNAERANWRMQQTMMAYLRVTAPFSGVITQRNVSTGALVSSEGKDNRPMLELKEVDHLRLQVDIPESISATLRKNQEISFYLSAYPGRRMSGNISRVSTNISMQYRSERVELDIFNKDGMLVPGMYADVLFNSKGNPNALSVPKSAVVTSTERKYVIAVRNGRTVRVDVSTGNESDSRIEIVGDLKAGEEVVANANDEIKEGLTQPDPVP